MVALTAALSLPPRATPAYARGQSRWGTPSQPLSTRQLPTSFGPRSLQSVGDRLYRAVAVDSDVTGTPEPVQQEKPAKYHFLVANAKFMLDEEEHFQELMSERLRYFGERNREQDFWIVIEPAFLKKFPDIAKRLKRPAAALVSTDGNWITFMKLRLDRVLSGSFEAETLDSALGYRHIDLNFEKPQTWTAPYPKYESGWWERFLPPASCKLHN